MPEIRKPDNSTEKRSGMSPLLRFAAFFTVACTLLAGIGEWRTLNDQIGALPKLFSLGVIACAFLCYLIKPDFQAAKKALSYIPVFALLLLVPLVTSLSTWVIDLNSFGSIPRGMEKILFQAVTIVYAVSMVYLFGEKAIDWFFLGIAGANVGIMLLELPNYGLAESVGSIVHGIVTFGEAEGFMRALELHDFSFLYGQLLIYYLMFAPRRTAREKRSRRIHVAACLFFLILAFKRLAFPGILLAILFAWLLRKPKKIRIWLAVLGAAYVAGAYFYVYLIYSGKLVALLHSFGINAMGRDTFWTEASKYYEFSVFWKGLGFEAVDTLVNSWVKAGIITRPYPLHNDFLKVFVELGSLGLALWTGIQYLYYPQYWAKKHSIACAVLYFSLITYMSVTYMTDNTAFYFWSSTGLRMIPMAFSFRKDPETELKNVWIPPDAAELALELSEREAAKRG